jgi:hypothetical protein
MAKRKLVIVKSLGLQSGCALFCSQQFKVPTTQLAKTADAQASLKEQFDRHKCRRLDESQNALRVVREATKD